MKTFADLSVASGAFLLIFFFAASLCALAEVFYDGYRKRNFWINLLIFLIQTLILISALCVDKGISSMVVADELPWVLPFAAAFMLWILTLFLLVKTRQRKKDELTPNAIKQFIDDMPTALCFADPEGRVVLCNREMIHLSFMLIDVYPQMLVELTRVFEETTGETRVMPVSEMKGHYRFPDGTIRRMTTRVFDKELTGWTQTTIADVTDLYEVNDELRTENEALSKTNEELRTMYDHMADAIREKESLELKIYIHDTLGRSLLTIRDILESSQGDMEEKIRELQKVVRMLSGNRPTYQNTMEEAIKKASEIGVEVRVDGYIPSDSSIERMTVSAIRECATNCIRHAKGDLLSVQIRENAGVYTVTITNNGRVPDGSIKEGSGLTSLRRSVEALGGEMYISVKPNFALIINLKKKGELS